MMEIAATPILKGKDARRFLHNERVNRTKCASRKVVAKAVRTFIAVCRKKRKSRRSGFQ